MKITFLPKFIFLVFFCLCASLFISPVYSQSISTGKVVGKIFLNSGELVPGVQVEITGPALLEGKRTAVSSENGSFFFLDLPIGKYRITASLEGFKTASYRDIAVTPGGSVTMSIIMEP